MGAASNIRSCTAAITGCERASRWGKALVLFSGLQFGRLESDLTSVNGILNACAESQQWRLSLQFQGDKISRNIQAKACAGPWAWETAAALAEGLQASSSAMQSVAWHEAAGLFQSLSSKVRCDTMAWASLVKACASEGRWTEALAAVTDIRQQALPPDGLLYNTLVSAGEKNTNWMAAVSMYEARAVWFGVDPSSASTSILACCNAAAWAQGLKMLCSLLRSRYAPSIHALAALISETQSPEVGMGH